MNKGLIEEVGRKETLGRPILYGTTDAFLSHFGLTSLEDAAPAARIPAGFSPPNRLLPERCGGFYFFKPLRRNFLPSIEYTNIDIF